jgi:membrane-associated phospholipid phosphatase
MARALVGGVAAVVAFVGVYAAFVLTRAGQRWEDAVLAGRSRAPDTALRTADSRLDTITVTTLVAAVVVVLAIALVRRRPLLGLGAAGVVCLALFLAEVLKRVVLPRPDRDGAPGPIAHNSFPSGHTTIAVALMFALIMVMPYRSRTWIALLAAVWGVGISGYTVTAGWHRPSDTIGAALLVVGVACAATLVLELLDRAGPVAPDGVARAFLRDVAVAPIALLAAGALAAGSLLAAYSQHQLNDPGADPAVADGHAYLAGRALAVGSSAAAVLALLFLLRHVDIGTHPARPSGRGLRDGEP